MSNNTSDANARSCNNGVKSGTEIILHNSNNGVRENNEYKMRARRATTARADALSTASLPGPGYRYVTE